MSTNITFMSLYAFLLQSVSRYKSLSESSLRKFSSSTGILASLPPSSGPTPSSPLRGINPTLSLPVTPLKYNDDMNETKMTNGTSGYLSESPPGDKRECDQLQTSHANLTLHSTVFCHLAAKQTLTFDLPDADEGDNTGENIIITTAITCSNSGIFLL